MDNGNTEMKKNGERESYTLLGIGFLLVAISAFFIGQYPVEGIEKTTFFASVISTIGVALIIIALVERVHLRKSLKEVSKEIVKDSTNNLDKKFKEVFEILEHSRYNGLIDILAPRFDEEKGDNTREIIAKEVEKSKTVYVLSISGLDFFSAPGGGLPRAGKSFEAIMKKITDAKKENKPFDLKIKALLMDPNSEAAKFRDEIESFEGVKGSIEKDIEHAKRGIQLLNTHAGKVFIEYRLYSIFPQVGFVLTDSCIFIEPYHFAPTKEFINALEEKKLKATTMVTNCTGGRVPILQFSSNSNIYIAMQKHFESIWKYEENKGKNKVLI